MYEPFARLTYLVFFLALRPAVRPTPLWPLLELVGVSYTLIFDPIWRSG